MSDRLKGIWGRFERATTRTLTGAGVDNIPAPRREARGNEAFTVIKDADAPSKAALAALRASARASADPARAKRGKAAAGAERPGKLLAPDAAAFLSEHDLSAPPEMLDGTMRDFRHDVAETARRIVRPDVDYMSYAADLARAELAKANKRRKFLGIF